MNIIFIDNNIFQKLIWTKITLFLVKRGRQRCRARMIGVVLGAECLYLKDGGPNEGVYHMKVNSISEFGRLVVKMLAKYWDNAQKVSSIQLRSSKVYNFIKIIILE